MKQERQYWLAVGGLVLAIAIVALRIFHQGKIVEFSDTIYPIRPDLTFRDWMHWWWPGNLGSVWSNSAWLTYLAIPLIAWKIHLAPGLAQSIQYFLWLGIPTIALAWTVAILRPRSINAFATLPLGLFAFNLYIAESWTSSVAMYAIGAAALLTLALTLSCSRRRYWRALIFVAIAALWGAPLAANPPYFLIAIAQAMVFATWLWYNNGRGRPGLKRFIPSALVLGLLMSARWIIPTIAFYVSYPLAAFDTVPASALSWIYARAHLINVLRYTPFWYWGLPEYTYFASAYAKNPFLVAGSFAPFLTALLAVAVAVRSNAKNVLSLLGVACIWFFLAKSANVPFASISQALNALPLMSLFRDSEKFLGPLLIDLTISTALAFTLRTKLRERWSISAIAVIGIVVGGWTLITGLAFSAPRGTPNIFVSIPRSYRNLNHVIKLANIHRVVTVPWDPFYTIGTRWGFLGANTEFFDDLADVPVFHQPYFSYVDHKYFDRLAKIYGEDRFRDAVARATLDRMLSIDGVVLRNDAMPYVGFEHFMWRPGDLVGEFQSISATRSLTVLKARNLRSLAYSSAFALVSDRRHYQSIFRLLTRLGISSLPLIESEKRASLRHVLRLSFGHGFRASAFLWRPSESSEKETDLPLGNYELVARAVPSLSQHFNLTMVHPIRSFHGTENVMGIASSLQHDPQFGTVTGETYTYLTEGPASARATLSVPLLAPSVASCATFSLNGRVVAMQHVGMGRQLVQVTITAPPGSFSLQSVFNNSAECGLRNVPKRPIWAATMSPPSALGVVRSRKHLRALYYSFHVDVPLRTFPSVWLRQAEENLPAVGSTVLSRADISGAGCEISVARQDTSGYSKMNVMEAFDNLALRPLLPTACRRASIDRLRVVKIEAIAVPSTLGSIPKLLALGINPARRAIVWHVAKLGSVSQGAMSPPGSQNFLFGAPLPLLSRPILRFKVASMCATDVDVTATTSNGPFIKDIIPLVSSAFNLRKPSRSTAYATIRESLFAVAPTQVIAENANIKRLTLTFANEKQPVAKCGGSIKDVRIGASALPSEKAAVVVNGRRIGIARDGQVHVTGIAADGGRQVVKIEGPIEGVALVPSYAMLPRTAVSATTMGIAAMVHGPGWIVYAQANDKWWNAKLDGLPLAQHRADEDLQAYYIGHSGRLNVYFSLGKLRMFAELLTWLTLVAVLVGVIMESRKR